MSTPLFFSLDNEYDADRLAMDLLVAAGYAPMGFKMSLDQSGFAPIYEHQERDQWGRLYCQQVLRH